MDALTQHLLPKWLLLVGAIATLNGLQNFVQPLFSTKVYSSDAGRAQVTALSARLFAIWNLTSAMIRIYAAFNMDERGAYLLCLGTFVIALGHFLSEMFYFRTMAIGTGSISPLIVATSSTVAMVKGYSFYVG